MIRNRVREEGIQDRGDSRSNCSGAGARGLVKDQSLEGPLWHVISELPSAIEVRNATDSQKMRHEP